MSESGTSSEHEFVATEDESGVRIDVALAKLMSMSRSQVSELLDANCVQVNRKFVSRSHQLKLSDHIQVRIPPERNPLEVVPEFVSDLIVLHDDLDLVVVEKPAGIAVHPSLGYIGPTVLGGLSALGYKITSHGAAERQGVVHRLDVGTSGVMVVAKSELAYSDLKQQFRERSVHKIYHALIHGRMDPLVGTIDAPIGRHPNHDWKFAVMAGGRDSITHYETLEAMAHASLLSVELETGRTHQIRVHFAALRHPCVGDEMYGADPSFAAKLGLTRQWLHAVELGFRHPASGDWVQFHSDYAADLQVALDRAREL